MALPAVLDTRRSPDAVSSEMRRCYEVVERMGRGVLYLGSSRVTPEHPHFQQAKQLSCEVAQLLDGVTTWSGLGGGFMDAVSQGALKAGSPAAGFKIAREGGRWMGEESTWSHPYLPQEAYVTCEFFSARKHGLVDAVTRTSADDRTAVVTLPGGTGTLDEFFEVAVLLQLERIGTAHKVPLILMNYDGFYDNMIKFFGDCVDYGAVFAPEVDSMFTVCNSNAEALAHIKKFYSL